MPQTKQEKAIHANKRRKTSTIHAKDVNSNKTKQLTPIYEFSIYKKYPQTRKNLKDVNDVLDYIQSRTKGKELFGVHQTRSGDKLRVQAHRSDIMDINSDTISRFGKSKAEKVGIRTIDQDNPKEFN